MRKTFVDTESKTDDPEVRLFAGFCGGRITVPFHHMIMACLTDCFYALREVSRRFLT